MEYLIQAENLHKSFGENHAVNGISLQVAEARYLVSLALMVQEKPQPCAFWLVLCCQIPEKLL